MSVQPNIPGYAAGSWVIDAARSTLSFQVSLLGIFKTRGTFDDFEGTIVTEADPLDSSVNAVIRSASVNTRNKRRDTDLRKAAYLAAETHPALTFASTGVRAEGDHFLVDGDLTIRGTTKRITLTVQPGGFSSDGESVARFTARTGFSRKEFGVTAVAGAIGDNVTVTLDIQARQA